MKKSKIWKPILSMALVFGMMLLIQLPGTVYAAEDVQETYTASVDSESLVVELPAQDLSAQQAATFSLDANGKPTLQADNFASWYARLDTSEVLYAQTFYDWLIENSDGDSIGDATDPCGTDWLIDPTKGTLRDDGTYVYEVYSYEWSEAFSGITDAGTGLGNAINAYLEEAASDTIAANFAEAQGYISAIYNAFDRDHPEVFWLSGSAVVGYSVPAASFSYSVDANGVASGEVPYTQTIYFVLQDTEPESTEDFADIRATDYLSVDTIASAITARDAQIDAIFAEIVADTEGEKYYNVYTIVKYFNDWLTANNCYNSSADLDAIDHDCRECTSALLGSNDTAGPVCEGYARAFKVLCDKTEEKTVQNQYPVSIQCTLVSGNAFASQEAVTNNMGEAHMWNLVADEAGYYYAVDVTWNDPTLANSSNVDKVSGVEHRDYLMVGSNTVIDELTFGTSHVATNVVSAGGVAFTNQPDMVADEYAYFVKFWVNNGTNDFVELFTVCDSPINMPDESKFVYEGYKLTGWNTKSDGTGTGYSLQDVRDGKLVPTDDMELYSKWESTIKNITLYANDGTDAKKEVSTDATGNYTFSDSIFTRENYAIDYWCVNEDCVRTSCENSSMHYYNGAGANFEEDSTFYAIWKQTVCTITFDANGGTGTMSPQKTDTNGNLTVQNQFTREGYQFEYWCTEANCGSMTGEVCGSAHYLDGVGSKFTEDTTLYAQWKEYYTISFDANGGTGTMENIVVLEGNDGIWMDGSEFQKEGYLFTGWNTKSDGTGTDYGKQLDLWFEDLTGDTTLYAQWGEAITITYKANGGIGEDYTETIAVGENYSPWYTDFYREGYKIAGWNTTGTGSEYWTDEEALTFDEDTKLYVIWEEWDNVLYIGDKELADGKYMDTTGTVSDTQPAGGYAYYEDNVLKLNNFVFEHDGYLYDTFSDVDGENDYEGEAPTITYNYRAVIYKEGSLTVDLIGDNVLTGTAANEQYVLNYSSGIYMVGSLTISGQGSLNVNTNDINLNAAYLVLDGCNLDLSSEYGNIVTSYDLTIKNQADVTGKIGGASDYTLPALYVGNDCTITDSTLDITGQDGMLIWGALSITDSTVEIDGLGGCIAVKCYGGITLNGVYIQTPYGGSIEKYEEIYSEEEIYVYYRIVDLMGSVVSDVLISPDEIPASIGETLTGYQASLDGNINMKFYFEFDDVLKQDEDAYVLITLPNQSTEEIRLSSVKEKDETTGKSVDGSDHYIDTTGYYVFTCEVAAKEMASDIKVQVIASETEKSRVYTYSVKEYAEYLIQCYGDPESLYYGDQYLYFLVRAMLNYGAYAQEYFGYNTDCLANESLDEWNKVTGKFSEALANPGGYFTPMSLSYPEGTTNDIGIFTRANLTLESDTILNVYFKPAAEVDSLDELEFRLETLGDIVDGEQSYITTSIIPVATGTAGEYLLQVRNIKAYQLDDSYTFVVSKKETDEVSTESETVEVASLTYNAFSYCYNILTSGTYSDELKNLCASLFDYYSSAWAYVANTSGSGTSN